MHETADLFNRISLKTTLVELVDHACVRFELGEPVDFKPVTTGYQDLNIKLHTARQAYLIKVFSKNRSLTNINDQIEVLMYLAQNNLPVPHLRVAYGKPLSIIESENGKAYVCVMDYFEGGDFTKRKPEKADIVFLAECLANLHNLPLKVSRYYDDWGAANLEAELNDKRGSLSESDLALVGPVAERLRAIDLKSFRQCTIHGDLYREHVLKNKQGDYCFIDFGCMDFNAAVLDLAIFIAHFCLDPRMSESVNRKVFSLAIETYQKTAPLSALELASLPVLI
ncbi:MAG: phosphotransferase, partial [Candidatus Obscuribacterales bacterium]|nr:phosphotransferase [Candidatus Obscuribacterales bacterium]